MGRGWILSALERYAEALEAYGNAIMLDAGRAVGHESRGAALAALGRHEEALEACGEAVMLDPGRLVGHTGRARPC